jgi:TonB family protein
MRLSINHFVVSSILAHAAVFAVWANTQSHTFTLPSALSSAPSFEIALLDAAKPTQKSQPRVHHPKHDKPEPTPQRQLATAKRVDSTPGTNAHTQHATTSAHAAELRRSEIRDRVLSKIRSHLNQYFVYPLLAQREGWQGQVLLGFSVEANGKIRNIHIAAGSGYPILDTSAVAALSRVQYLYEASGWLQGRRLELQMPVIFRLQGG